MKTLCLALIGSGLALSACGLASAPSPLPTRTAASALPTAAATKAVQPGTALTVQNQKTESTAGGNRASGEIVTDEKLSVGQMDVAYPDKMQLGESRAVVLRVAPSGQLLSLRTGAAPGSAKASNLPDTVFKYTTKIDIYPVMLAELRAVNFDIDLKGPQRRDLRATDAVTWTWVISPRVAGAQTLSLEIAIPAVIGGNTAELSVLQSIPLSVQVDAPKPTPVPLGDQIAKSIADNAGAIIVALIGLLGTMLGLWAKGRAGNGKRGK